MATPNDKKCGPGVDEGLLIRQHHLPHWQAGGSYYFVTFRSARGELLPEARRIVLDCLLHGDGHRYDVIAAVIMPDHVHCILHPRLAREGHWHDLAAVLKPLKGVSARLINQQLGGKGTVWQAESFDRIIRTPKEYEAKIWYMRHNPVTAGLVAAPEEYEFRIDRRDIV